MSLSIPQACGAAGCLTKKRGGDLEGAGREAGPPCRVPRVPPSPRPPARCFLFGRGGERGP
uniref:Uncharacterized protein n=1 Tax=Human herpesvirus 2 TaxID=10310 RepID=A0A481TVC9_HHV2|nr:hypothetical protein [Human alphaherpesvirus 2]